MAAGLGAAGQWGGGLAGAALIAAGGFVAPEVSDWLKERRARAAERASADQAARTTLDRTSNPAVAPPVAQARGGAAFWLRPDQRVVSFIDRPELARLRQWCAVQNVPEVMLLTGAGGVGKTRLALRLAEEQQDQGWLCRMVRAEEEAEVVAAARAVSRAPVLLIVDYAETRKGLAGLLTAAADDGGDGLRVLLAARSAGEWWAQLEASTDNTVRTLAATAQRVAVGSLAGGAVSGADLVRAAVPEFARAVGVAVPGTVQVTVPEGPVPILVLHAAALLAVLEARDSPQAGPMQVVADEELVLAGLLAREKSFWLGSARTAELAGPGGVDSVTAAQSVAVACLITVADENEAAQALRRIPRLSDAPFGTLLRIAGWLRQLYPVDRAPTGAKVPWWGSLQPDLLAEWHVVSVLADADATGLAVAALRDLTAVQARGALTVLARACAHHSKAPGIIEVALRADLPGLGLPAVEVAVQTPGKLGAIIAGVLSDADVPLEILMQIEEAIPYPTVALAEADVIVAERISEMLPADTDRAEIARRRDLLGVLLSQAGRPHQALPPAQEAVEIRRELAAARPDRYRPDLAASLSNLGIWFSELGRPAEALPPAQEAVAAYRELAAASPDRYRPDLATSLANLGIWFSELGRPAEALPPAQEAVAIYRELAAASPDRYRPDLAASLSNLGIWFFELGRPAEALPPAQEAVEIRRELAAASPDRYRPDLATSLANLGIWFSELGRPAEALPPAQEAVEIRRELAAASPDRYRPDLATSLSNLGVRFSELGRPAEALPPAQEAVAIYRELAAASPDRYRPDLAASLDNLGVRFSELGRPAEALPPAQEAVEIRRELAAASPDRYRPDLATSLSNLGVRFFELGRPAEALPPGQEAVAILPGAGRRQPRPVPPRPRPLAGQPRHPELGAG